MTQRFAKIATRDLAREALIRKTENVPAGLKNLNARKCRIENQTKNHAGINGAIESINSIQTEKQLATTLVLSFFFK